MTRKLTLSVLMFINGERTGQVQYTPHSLRVLVLTMSHELLREAALVSFRVESLSIKSKIKMNILGSESVYRLWFLPAKLRPVCVPETSKFPKALKAFEHMSKHTVRTPYFPEQPNRLA